MGFSIKLSTVSPQSLCFSPAHIFMDKYYWIIWTGTLGHLFIKRSLKSRFLRVKELLKFNASSSSSWKSEYIESNPSHCNTYFQQEKGVEWYNDFELVPPAHRTLVWRAFVGHMRVTWRKVGIMGRNGTPQGWLQTKDKVRRQTARCVCICVCFSMEELNGKLTSIA